ncbi:hypothetical protein JBE04_06505 [Streptomyces sp. PRKS01-29]|nr:hypothetical protein [Streptomyces sabulosicollis]MBI0294140.1 hypothetical protein [Streptomyces sabulosicollis]
MRWEPFREDRGSWGAKKQTTWGVLLSNDAPAHPDRIRAGHWITVLIERFPQLQAELTPSARRPGPGRPRGGADRRWPSEPLRLRVSDTVRDITDGVVELEEAVHDRLGMPPADRGTVEVRLARLTGLLERVEADQVLMRHLLDEVSGMARRCSGALGDRRPRQPAAGGRGDRTGLRHR